MLEAISNIMTGTLIFAGLFSIMKNAYNLASAEIVRVIDRISE